MQREKVVEIARKSCGMFLEQGTPGVTAVHKLWEFWPDGLLEFARLVELETLEMAARVCKDKSMKMENEASLAETQDDAISLRSSAWLISVCGHEIRNLKETNDKE